MECYYIFWIKEEFAYHYFYKNEILFRFLRMHQNNTNRTDLSTQYRHITYRFSKQKLIAHLKASSPHNISIETEQNEINIYHSEKQQSITLHIHDKHLEFYTESLHDAEELLFKALRLFQPLLFIMHKNTEQFGWISPVLNTYEFKNSPRLYSHQ